MALAELVFTHDREQFHGMLMGMRDEFFFRGNHRKLLDAVRKLDAEDAGLPLGNPGEGDFTWGVVNAYFIQAEPEWYDQVGRKLLAELWKHFACGANIEWLTDELIALAVQRHRQTLLSQELERRKGLTAEEFRELTERIDAEARETHIEWTRAKKRPKDVEQSWEVLLEHARLRKRGGGLTLGLPTVDRGSSGLMPGELCLLAGRSNVGKTTLVANILHHRVTRPPIQGEPNPWTMVFSLDMPGPAIAEKVIMRTGEVTWRGVAMEHDRDVPKVVNAIQQYTDRLFIADTPGLSVPEVVSLCMQQRTKLGGRPLELVVIDHHGELRASGRARSPYEVASETAQAVKQAAKDLDTVVLLLVQLSRKGGSGEIEPTLDMLRDTGRLEEEADLVLGVWRPDIGDREKDRAMKLKVMKARRMAQLEAELLWRPDVAFVGELTQDEPPEDRRLF